MSLLKRHSMSFHLSYTGDEVQSLLEMAGTALQEHQDLSNYYTKGEVDDAILEETIRATIKEEEIEILVEEIQEQEKDTQSRVEKNENAIKSVEQEVCDISLSLSEVSSDFSERLTKMEAVVGVDNADGGGTTLLERVDATASAVIKLTTRISANEQAVSLLNGDSTKKGSVDYKIKQALAWENIG